MKKEKDQKVQSSESSSYPPTGASPLDNSHPHLPGNPTKGKLDGENIFVIKKKAKLYFSRFI